MQIIGTFLFAMGLVHMILAQSIPPSRRAQFKPFWYWFTEVELILAYYAFVLIAFFLSTWGAGITAHWLGQKSFIEPVFVFCVLALCSSRYLVIPARNLLLRIAKNLPVPRPQAVYFSTLFLGSLLGSLITEPAAMTLSALILRNLFPKPSSILALTTLACLFVCVSVGGALTPFAAPPILMVKEAFGLDFERVFFQFGIPALTSVGLIALIATLTLSKSLKSAFNLPNTRSEDDDSRIVTREFLGLLALLGVALWGMHSYTVLGVMIAILALSGKIYKATYARTLFDFKTPALVSAFLASLVVFGSEQSWWVAPLLTRFEPIGLFTLATGLTSMIDNAAITLLASQVPGFDYTQQNAVVSGALVGGGLTLIANAPNILGFTLLMGWFPQGLSAWKLFVTAMIPTAITYAAFLLQGF